MIVYKTRWFDRWANKQGLTLTSLCAAVREMTEGLYDADLGNGLLKKNCATRTRKEKWFSHIGCHQQRKPLDILIWFPKERA